MKAKKTKEPIAGLLMWRSMLCNFPSDLKELEIWELAGKITVFGRCSFSSVRLLHPSTPSTSRWRWRQVKALQDRSWSLCNAPWSAACSLYLSCSHSGLILVCRKLGPLQMLYGNRDICTGLEELVQKILLFQDPQPEAGRNACECLNAALKS